MTREEEIVKQADIYTDDASNYAEWSNDGGWSEKNDIELVEKAFIEGAKWADEHPNPSTIKKIFEFALEKTNLLISDSLESIDWEVLIKKAMEE